MRHKINNILQNLFGIKFVPAGLNYIKRRKIQTTNPVYVELFGVSGVGKSTLLKEAEKINKNTYLSLRDFQFLYSDYAVGSILNNLPQHQFLADHKINEIIESPHYGLASVKLGIFKFNYTALIADALVIQYNKKYRVISDEGLIQIFTNGFLKLYEEDTEGLRQFFEHRAFIYCYASPERIAKQILEREYQTGNRRIEHEADTFEELVSRQRDELKQKEEIHSLLKKYNTPVLTINVSESLKENAFKINEFISNL